MSGHPWDATAGPPWSMPRNGHQSWCSCRRGGGLVLSRFGANRPNGRGGAQALPESTPGGGGGMGQKPVAEREERDFLDTFRGGLRGGLGAVEPRQGLEA